jgi:serine/threonine-protein kinase
MSLDAERWARLKDEFARLAALVPADRESRLATIARSEPDFSEQLRNLLAGDEQADDRLRHIDLITTPAAAGSGGALGSGAADPFALAGTIVSHFHVLDVLGAGGMGVVYRAEDMRLRRHVALKFLLPQYSLDTVAKERFLHEARAASALDHPNVCTIHEVGESDTGQLFLAMPVYAGETLKEHIARAGALPTAAALAIARQTLLGLAAAHGAGITHRDLKPANLMITPDGTVKILDFGLAKMKDLQLTQPALRPGTVAYMSPEQLAGAPLDHRTDLWSLGVVLYEMLTGVRPFGGGHDLSTLYSILHEPPAPPSTCSAGVPPWVDELVAALICRDLDERCATAADALATIEVGAGQPPHAAGRSVLSRWRGRMTTAPRAAGRSLLSRGRGRVATALSLAAAIALAAGAFAAVRSLGSADTPAPAPAPADPAPGSLAVLPFIDTTPGEEEEYFAAGITEEILNALAQLPELRVTARTSSFAFRGTNLRARDIARQLGVAAVLEGSVHRAGDQLRITTRLIDARSDSHIWSQTFDRGIDDIFAVQAEIARTVATALKVRLVPGPQAAAPPTRDIAAYERYLRGLFHWNRRSTQDVRQAILFFEQAIQLDSTYAQPYAGLALAHAVLQLQDASVSAADELAAVESAAARALALNPYLAEAHAARAYSYHWQWRWDDAEREFNQALSLNPAYATAHQWYGEHLTKMGRGREGEAEMRTALALDPLSLVIHNDLGIVLMLSGRFDEAIAQLERVHAMDPAFSIPLQVLHRVHLLTGDAAAAADAGRRWAELSGVADPADIELLARATRDTLLLAGATEVLERWSRGPAPRWSDIAMYYALMHEHDRSIMALQRAFESRTPMLAQLKVAAWLDPLRSDPRVIAVLRQMAFP